MADWSSLAWPSSRLGEAIVLLARRCGLHPRPATPSSPPASDLNEWIRARSRSLGIEAKPVSFLYPELDEHILRSPMVAHFEAAIKATAANQASPLIHDIFLMDDLVPDELSMLCPGATPPPLADLCPDLQHIVQVNIVLERTNFRAASSRQAADLQSVLASLPAPLPLSEVNVCSGQPFQAQNLDPLLKALVDGDFDVSQGASAHASRRNSRSDSAITSDSDVGLESSLFARPSQRQ